MITITTGRVSEEEALKQAGWTAINVTVKSAKEGAKSLAPTWKMVMGYKEGALSEEEYTKKYIEILRRSQQREKEKWVNTLRRHSKIAFLCFCKAGDFCHRVLLAKEFIHFAREEMNLEATLIPETKDRFNSSPTISSSKDSSAPLGSLSPISQSRQYFKGFITNLKKDEVFVFGSNERGFHGAGAAGLAMRNDARNTWRQDRKFLQAMNAPKGHSDRVGHWAIYGIGRGYQEGFNGASYAIATVTQAGAQRSISLDKIYSQLVELGGFASDHPEKTFFCAINGGGLNGWTKDEIRSIYRRWEKENPPPGNIVFPEDMKPPNPSATGDGADHINIYSKGETPLGRWMSNFAYTPLTLDGLSFDSIEGYWYWLSVDAPDQYKRKLRTLHGFEAKKAGKALIEKYGKKENPKFEEKIKAALRAKVEESPSYATQLKDSNLPFRHYYNFGGTIRNAGFEWITKEWEVIRRELKNSRSERKRIIVAGSRDFNDYEFMKQKLNPIVKSGDAIISGTARGADKLGERYAEENRHPLISFPADWDKHGRAAGPIRNEQMAREGDVLCAFWDGKSRGAKSMIDLARKHGLEVYVFKF